MKAQIESTSKIVTLVINGVDVPARVWEGYTEAGVPFHCFVTRVAVSNDPGVDRGEFERELLEQKAPTPEIQAIPLRMVL